jgi:integrase
MSENLTLARVAKFVRDGLPAGKSSAALWATAPKGLGLRLRLGGAAAWIFMYRPSGAGRGEPSRTVTLGRYGSLSLAQALAAATALAGDVALQKDPAVERRVERSRDKNVLSKALEGFEAALKQRKIVNRATIMSTLRRGLEPLLTREIDTIERKDLVALIDGLEAAGKAGAAQDLRKHSRSLLEWSVTKGLTKYNVLAGMRRPRASRAERLDDDERKGRALDEREIRALWTASAELGAFGGLMRLGVLTGLRRSELSGLRWSDVLDDKIVIAADRAKTGVRHEVPLTSAMRAVLSAQPRTMSDLVFPGRNGARMAGWSKLVPRAARASKVEFRLHDLRRTARSLMSVLNVPEEIAELAIGHVRRGLIGTYNKDSAWTSRVEAFEKMSAHIASVIASSGDESEGEASNVVTHMRAAAKSA